MASTMRPVLVGSLLPLLLACGGAPKETAKSPAVAPAPSQVVVAPAPDLSPVPAPAELVALGRLARPATFLSTVSGWAGIPFEPKMIDAMEPGLSEALALDAPIEFAVALPPGGQVDQQPNIVVSVGVASTDRARTLLEGYNGSSLTEQSPMVWVAAEDAKAHCAVAASLGKVNARLVCATEAKALAALLPYATRGLPLEDLGNSEFRAEVRAEPLQKRFAAAARMGKVVAVPAFLKEIALGDSRFDRPVADATHAVGDEFIDWFEDLDLIRVDLSAQANPEQFEARFSLAYKSHKSLMASGTAAAKGRMSAPSPMFFELPATATGASFRTAMDAKLWERSRLLGTAVLDGFLSHLSVGASLRRDLVSGLEGVLSRGDAVVSAQIPVDAASGKTPSTDAERMSSMLGQYVVGIEGPAAPYRTWLKSLVPLYNDRAFRKGLDQLVSEKLEPGTKDKVASAKTKPAKPVKSLLDLVKVKTKTVKGLPQGSEVLTLTIETKDTEEFIGAAQKKLHRRGKVPQLAVGTATLCIAVVPDGSRTWMLVAADEKSLPALAKLVLPGSTVPKLSTRSDVAPLRGQAAYQSGFFSLASLKGYLTVMMQTRGKSGDGAESLFSVLPHHGQTPAFYQYVVTGDEQRPTLEGRITLPRSMFDDIAAAVPALMMSM